MTVQRIKKLPAFNGVAAGQQATLNVPIGDTYDVIFLKFAQDGVLVNQSVMESRIDEVRLNINGVTRRRMSAQDIIDINAYHGIEFVNGYLPLIFRETWGRTSSQEDGLALGTLNLQTVTIEVDINSIATNPSLEAIAEYQLQQRRAGVFKQILKNTIPINSVGDNTYQGNKIGDIFALHCRSGDINSVRTEVDSINVADAAAEDFDVILKYYQDKTPQTGYVHIDFNRTNRYEDRLPMVKGQVDSSGKIRNPRQIQDFPIIFNMETATSFPMIEERLITL